MDNIKVTINEDFKFKTLTADDGYSFISCINERFFISLQHEKVSIYNVSYLNAFSLQDYYKDCRSSC